MSIKVEQAGAGHGRKANIVLALILVTLLLYEVDRPERSFHARFEQIQVGMNRSEAAQLFKDWKMPPCPGLIVPDQHCWFSDSKYTYMVEFLPGGDIVVSKRAIRLAHASVLDRIYGWILRQ